MDRYASPGAYRRALEDRLRRRAEEMALPLQRLRTRLAMERLLARLFSDADVPWLLKGGYAFELRFAPRARTTRDIDLNLPREGSRPSWSSIRDRLQDASSTDLGDGFLYEIGPPRQELQGAPDGGARYPVISRVAGREFARFHLDVGVGDPITGEPEELEGLDLLSFAGIPPARVRSVPLEQLFAEKLHAYTLPWEGRENTRVKDLIDLALLQEAGLPPLAQLRRAVESTFAERGRQPVPSDLPSPPVAWDDEYRSLARELGLAHVEAAAAIEALRKDWRRIRGSRS